MRQTGFCLVMEDRQKARVAAPIHGLEPEQYPWLGVKVFAKLRSRYLYPGRTTQGVCRRASAFNCNSSLRITATKAKFPGFPR